MSTSFVHVRVVFKARSVCILGSVEIISMSAIFAEFHLEFVKIMQNKLIDETSTAIHDPRKKPSNVQIFLSNKKLCHLLYQQGQIVNHRYRLSSPL